MEREAMTRFTVSPDGWEEDTLWAMEPAGPIAVLQARDLGHSHQYWPELVALIMGPDLIDQAITNEPLPCGPQPAGHTAFPCAYCEWLDRVDPPPDLIDQAITTEQHNRDTYHRQQSGVRG